MILKMNLRSVLLHIFIIKQYEFSQEWYFTVSYSATRPTVATLESF